MLERSVALTRPPPPAEDAAEDAPAPPSAPTFRLLDQALPTMYLPNVAYTRTMVYFKYVNSCNVLTLQIFASNVCS